jgi:hypothetical protein
MCVGVTPTSSTQLTKAMHFRVLLMDKADKAGQLGSSATAGRSRGPYCMPKCAQQLGDVVATSRA